MSEHLLDTIFNNKLQQHVSHVPDNLFDKIVTELNVDALVKNKLENFASPVSNNLFDTIIAATDTDSFIKSKLENHSSAVPYDLFNKIVAVRATDKYIKEKLENYESPVAEEVWEKIEEDEERRRPFGWWWFTDNGKWLAAASLLILLLGGYLMVANNKTNHTVDQTNTVVLPQKNNNNNVADDIIDKNNINKNNISSQQNTVTNNNPNIVIDKSIFNQQKNFNSNQFNKPLNDNGNGSITNNNFSANNNFNNLSTTGSLLNNNYSSENAGSDFDITNKKILPTDLYSLNNLNALYAVKNLTNAANAKGVNIVGCPNGSNADWFIEAYASPDYAMKSVTSYGLSSSYLEKKDSAETLRVGFTAGVKLTKRIGDHFILKTGLQYSQINEQFALRTENERKTTTVIVSRTIVRSQGDTTINDTTSVTQIGYRVQKSINKYHNIELPINIGYEFGHDGDNWRVGLNGGAIINLTSWYQGQTLDTSYNVISINSKGNSGVYKKSVGVSLYGGVSVIRKVNENLDVFAEPYFRYNLSGLSSNVGYNEKFSAAGITIGARVKINNRRQQ